MDIDSSAAAPPPTSSWIRANLSPRRNFKHDLPASMVVFLVALPLCLGIALASGAPLLAGVITGIVGGIVVSWLSGSSIAVSGPAAGLTVIVLDGIQTMGSFEAFLLAVALSGVFQLLFGLLRAGLVAYYFPSTVIKGLLAAIGLILILKQIPHAIGFDKDYEGDESFIQPDGRNTFTEIIEAFGHINLGAVTIAVLGLCILLAFERFPRFKLKWLPGPLLVVVLGVVLNELFRFVLPGWVNAGELLVRLPTMADGGILAALTLPAFEAATFMDPKLYQVAATVAVVASIETLLCIEAMDKLDPFRRNSDPNRELRAQGIGNIIAGLLGGIPMTAVIVRGSANVQAGGRTPVAAFGHGVLLLVSIIAIPTLLNRIPLAALAAVLLHVGFKLAPPTLFRRMYRQGRSEFIPFIVTVVAILLTDLLIGVAVGMATGVFFILKANLATPYYLTRHDVRVEDHTGGLRVHVEIQLSENVSFLNKASFSKVLQEIPDRAVVEIDGSFARFIDRDVLEIIHDFKSSAQFRGIDVNLTAIPAPNAAPDELTWRQTEPLVTEESRRLRLDVPGPGRLHS